MIEEHGSVEDGARMIRDDLIAEAELPILLKLLVSSGSEVAAKLG